MKQTIIFGAGSLAQMACYYLQKNEPGRVAGFVVDTKYLESDIFMGLPVAGNDVMVDAFPPEKFDMLVAVGYSSMRGRVEVIERMALSGYEFTNLVPAAGCDADITGVNNIILPGSLIEPFTVIGSSNIIWSGAHICHDAVIGDNNFFAAGSVTGGYTKVTQGCFIGFGSVVIEQLTMAEETLVAAGAVVVKNTEPHGKYIGVPARRVGEHGDTGIQV